MKKIGKLLGVKSHENSYIINNNKNLNEQIQDYNLEALTFIPRLSYHKVS